MPCDDSAAQLRSLENEKSLEMLAGCVGQRLTGYGCERGMLVLRFADGTRARLHVDVLSVLDGMADVMSAFGCFIGGELVSVADRTLTLRGIGEVEILV